MPDIYSLGEVLVAFIAKDVDSVESAREFILAVVGAEANVAVGATRLGLNVALQSRVGCDQLGSTVLSFLESESLSTELIYRGGSFTGALVRNQGDTMPISVDYLRAGSAASRMEPADIDVEKLAQSKGLHVTGITCAISDSAKDTVRTALQLAHNEGVKVCFDLNIRKKLWSESQARSSILPLLPNVDLLVGGISEYETIFAKGNPEENLEAAIAIGIVSAVMTDGPGTVRVLEKEGRYEFTPNKVKTVDPVGSGDAFVSGLLSGLVGGLTFREAVAQGSVSGSRVASNFGDWMGLPYGKNGILK